MILMSISMKGGGYDLHGDIHVVLQCWCRDLILKKASLVFTGQGLTATLFESHELWSKPTDCSRTPLIAKWYLGVPLTNSLVPK